MTRISPSLVSLPRLSRLQTRLRIRSKQTNSPTSVSSTAVRKIISHGPSCNDWSTSRFPFKGSCEYLFLLFFFICFLQRYGFKLRCRRSIDFGGHSYIDVLYMYGTLYVPVSVREAPSPRLTHRLSPLHCWTTH